MIFEKNKPTIINLVNDAPNIEIYGCSDNKFTSPVCFQVYVL